MAQAIDWDWLAGQIDAARKDGQGCSPLPVLLMALLQTRLQAEMRRGAAQPSDFTQMIVDATAQEKNIAHPVDVKMYMARRRLMGWRRSTAFHFARATRGWASGP